MGSNGGQKQPANQADQGNVQRGRTGAGAAEGAGQQGGIRGSEAAGHGISPGQGTQAEGIEGQGAQGQGAQQRTETGGPGTAGDTAAEVRGSQLNTPPTQPDLGAGGQQGQTEGREIT